MDVVHLTNNEVWVSAAAAEATAEAAAVKVAMQRGDQDRPNGHK